MAALRNVSPAFIAIALIANTSMIFAFRREGAHAAEFDVSMSQDGKISVLHDKTLQRTAAEHRPKFETDQTNDTSAAKKAKSKSVLNIEGHRGSSTDSPENTIASTKLDFDQGAHVAEFDASMSQDGKISVLHDRTLQRPAAEHRPKFETEQTIDTPASSNAKTKIVGHRGSSTDAPENTIASVILAFAQGAHGAEFDVSQSLDGKIFVLHDRTLQRTAAEDCPEALCGEDGKRKVERKMSPKEYKANLLEDVSKLSYEEFIKHVDVSSKLKPGWYDEFIKHVDVRSTPVEHVQHPPLMEDVMKVVPDDRFVLCDMKKQTMIAYAVAELTTAHNWQPETLRFLASSPLACATIKLKLRGFDVSFVMRAGDTIKALRWVTAANWLYFDSVDFQADRNIITAEVIEAAREARKDVGVWVDEAYPDWDTVANLNFYRKLGVEHFTSNLPDTVQSLLKP